MGLQITQIKRQNPFGRFLYDLRPGNGVGLYSGRKERDGQKKKIVKANEKREK